MHNRWNVVDSIKLHTHACVHTKWLSKGLWLINSSCRSASFSSRINCKDRTPHMRKIRVWEDPQLVWIWWHISSSLSSDRAVPACFIVLNGTKSAVVFSLPHYCHNHVLRSIYIMIKHSYQAVSFFKNCLSKSLIPCMLNFLLDIVLYFHSDL